MSEKTTAPAPKNMSKGEAMKARWKELKALPDDEPTKQAQIDQLKAKMFRYNERVKQKRDDAAAAAKAGNNTPNIKGEY
jgi:hypothetical protein